MDDQESNLKNSTERTNHSFGFWFGILLGLIFLDQIVKFIVVKTTSGVFHNTQFAFSLPVPLIVMYAIYIIAVALIIWYLSNTWNKLDDLGKFSWLLILAGGLSNIGERLVLGYV